MQPIEVPTTRSRSSEARPWSGEGSVVIVGGYGAVGRVVAATLAERGVPVTVAGRDLRRAQELARRHPDVMTPRRVDVDQPDELESVLDGAAVVVMCVERRNEQVAHACLERGIHVVDISATPAVLDAIERLDTVAERAGATAVLSVGLAPGLTNVLARWCVARLPSAASVDISILLGLAGDHGPDSARWTMDNLTSRERWGRGLGGSRCPGSGGVPSTRSRSPTSAPSPGRWASR
ncbi:saccharopine dehydrogenase family protein [Luedemannella helvata]|uniref:Saccharopine dehydrogenase NADP binding domain-containing protein n=1 Tax=Luedemannella helvata TaxID=349315 RepID=A0ABP4WYD0_9ACTN